MLQVSSHRNPSFVHAKEHSLFDFIKVAVVISGHGNRGNSDEERMNSNKEQCFFFVDKTKTGVVAAMQDSIALANLIHALPSNDVKDIQQMFIE